MTQMQLPWHLAALDVPLLASQGLKGEGVTVGVVDTGVVQDHPGLRGRSVQVFSAAGPGFSGCDLDGHGTSMIGLIVGAQVAIAPQANIVSVKSLMSGPVGSPDRIARGIEIALEHDADIVLLSTGTSSPTPSLAESVRIAVDSGVVVVAAADNEASTADVYPAAYEGVVAVTAVDRDGDPLFEVLPNWVAVGAPGVDLATLTLSGTGTVTGTSAAAAVCVAVCATLLGIVPVLRRRSLGRHLRTLLTSTGRPMGESANSMCPRLLAPAAGAQAIREWLEEHRQ